MTRAEFATSIASQRGEAAGADPYAVLVQPDGKIYVAGQAGFEVGSAYLARFLPNGQLDLTFGQNGLVNTGADRFDALARQSDGKIIAVGGIGEGASSAVVARFWP